MSNLDSWARGVPGRLAAKSQALKVRLDLRVQSPGLGLLLPPLGGESGHLVLEGFAVVGLRLRADVAAGGEYVAVFANFFQRCALAEAGNVGVAITPVPSTGQDLALSHQGLYRYEPHTLTHPLCILANAGMSVGAIPSSLIP